MQKDERIRGLLGDVLKALNGEIKSFLEACFEEEAEEEAVDEEGEGDSEGNKEDGGGFRSSASASASASASRRTSSLFVTSPPAKERPGNINAGGKMRKVYDLNIGKGSNINDNGRESDLTGLDEEAQAPLQPSTFNSAVSSDVRGASGNDDNTFNACIRQMTNSEFLRSVMLDDDALSSAFSSRLVVEKARTAKAKHLAKAKRLERLSWSLHFRPILASWTERHNAFLLKMTNNVQPVADALTWLDTVIEKEFAEGIMKDSIDGIMDVLEGDGAWDVVGAATSVVAGRRDNGERGRLDNDEYNGNYYSGNYYNGDDYYNNTTPNGTLGVVRGAEVLIAKSSVLIDCMKRLPSGDDGPKNLDQKFGAVLETCVLTFGARARGKLGEWWEEGEGGGFGGGKAVKEGYGIDFEDGGELDWKNVRERVGGLEFYGLGIAADADNVDNNAGDDDYLRPFGKVLNVDSHGHGASLSSFPVSTIHQLSSFAHSLLQTGAFLQSKISQSSRLISGGNSALLSSVSHLLKIGVSAALLLRSDSVVASAKILGGLGKSRTLTSDVFKPGGPTCVNEFIAYVERAWEIVVGAGGGAIGKFVWNGGPRVVDR